MLERTVGVQPLRVAVYCFCFILYHKSHEVSAKMRKRSNVCVWLGAGTQLATTFRHVLYTHTHWRGRWRSFQSPTLMHATICVFGWHDSAKIPTVTRHILINQSLVSLFFFFCWLVVRWLLARRARYKRRIAYAQQMDTDIFTYRGEGDK